MPGVGDAIRKASSGARADRIGALDAYITLHERLSIITREFHHGQMIWSGDKNLTKRKDKIFAEGRKLRSALNDLVGTKSASAPFNEAEEQNRMGGLLGRFGRR